MAVVLVITKAGGRRHMIKWLLPWGERHDLGGKHRFYLWLEKP